MACPIPYGGHKKLVWRLPSDSSREPGELSQWISHGDSKIGIYYYYYYYYYYCYRCRSSSCTVGCIAPSLPPPRGYVYVVVCLFVSNFAQKLPKGMKFSGKFVNGPLNKMIKFRWRSGSRSGYRDCFPDSSLFDPYWEIRKVVNGRKFAAHTD